VKVQIHDMNGEITFTNNQAQENFGEFETGASSPYTPVEFDVIARNPYDAPAILDLRARRVPTDWFVAFDHGSVWLGPKESKPVHVVIWTDRAAEWSQDERERRSPRKVLIGLEGWTDAWRDQYFPVGGVTAFVQAVRNVSVNADLRGGNKVDEPVRVFGRVSPPTGKVPLAFHVVDPQGERHSERAATDAEGFFNHAMSFRPRIPGKHRLTVYVLGGSLAGEAESSDIEFTVH
jgi:hypothetical protein